MTGVPCSRENNGEAPSVALAPGKLIALKTLEETKGRTDLITVYVTLVPAKQASEALRLVQPLIPTVTGLNLQHLRRFAKLSDVPRSVRDAFSRDDSTLVATATDTARGRLLFIIGPIASVSKQALIDLFSSIQQDIPIREVAVPLLAPTSQAQATKWTLQCWPSIYKKTNPFGPHPSMLSQAEKEVRPDVEKWMTLASRAAEQSTTAGIGEEVGVVIVEREQGCARPLVVVGDARWLRWPQVGVGNVTAHAVLQAISLISEGVKSQREGGRSTNGSQNDQKEVMENGLFSHEWSKDAIKQQEQTSDEDKYLCHGLEIYCTHEPCSMCSMAIVHSRFSRVVFKHAMPLTGGLHANNELGHGLFWRKELNWALLAWQWCSEDTAKVEVPNKCLYA